jgi:hypothetical protein
MSRMLRRLLDHRFEWVFAGHGGSHYVAADEMKARLEALLKRMATTWTFGPLRSHFKDRAGNQTSATQ